MCEKRMKKIKKASNLTRLREARRLQRIQRLASPATNASPNALPCPPVVDKTAQNRVILALAWKTVALMQKNRLIQQKIIALQKETSDFVASVMSNPENKKRYYEHIRMYGVVPQQIQLQLQQSIQNNNVIPVKLEPNE